MRANDPSDSGIAAFGDFILANRDGITKRWVSVVERTPEVRASDHLTYRQLLDHLPEICAELAGILQDPASQVPHDQASEYAAEHGAQRWELGYGLEELIREIAVIRKDFIGHWFDAFAQKQGALATETRRSAKAIVHRFFDDMIISSTRQFVEEQQRAALEAKAALSRAEARAEAAAEAKVRFVGLVSHELRTPLTPMVLAAVTLAQEELSAEGRESLRVILHTARLEAAIVDDLLDASRVVEHDLVMNLQPLDVHACLRAAFDACSLEFEMKDIKPEVLLLAESHRLHGDYPRLMRAFLALLRNAANVSPAGGQVVIRTGNADGCIDVSITDSGIKLDEKLNEAVFLPFEEGRRSPFGLGGVGVSRYVCKKTIEAHGGVISATSKGSDHGGVYVLRLPLADA
jgi:signal transduction histidine kinase